jgi:hypothetical protein
MTHIWLRQASDVSTSTRPSTQSPPRQFPIVMTSSSRLRPTSRLSHLHHPDRFPEISLGFGPFQRRYHRTSPTSFQTRRSPLTGFCNLSAGTTAPHDSRVYSTPMALLGYRSTEFYPETIGIRLPDPCFFIVFPSLWVSFLVGSAIPACHPPRWVSLTRDSHPSKTPDSLAEAGSHFGVGSILKLCSRFGALCSRPGFTPNEQPQLS